MLKSYLESINRSIYSVSKESGIPYSTLNDIVNNKVDIGNCKVSILRSLSKVLGISMDEIYCLASVPERTVTNSYDVVVFYSIRNKTYYALFEYQGEQVELELCKVNDNTSYCIEEIMKWRSEAYIRERRMAEFQ